MENIRNHIEAKNKPLVEILTNNRFKIDVFQREYRWKRKQIEAMISDLYSNFMRYYKQGDGMEEVETYGTYYMGPIVLCKDSKGLSIVDGQQRLTSLTLLIVYLLHEEKKLQLSEEQCHSYDSYLYVKKGGRVSLVIDVQSRMEVMEHLIKTGESNLGYDGTENDESVANILERYDDICMLFPDDVKSPSIFPLFVEWLVNNVVLVEIKTFTVDNAYLIFETMNDRGLSLNPSEIIKAFLMSKIDDEEKAEECNVFWKERMAEVKACAGDEGDMSFFRAWLRAKYAITKKINTSGSSMEDYELIGNQFHSWMKNHLSVLKLSTAQDYYFFIKSDFEFYTRLYMQIIEYRTKSDARDPMFNIVSNYCIADSLYMPLMMASVQKSDDQVTIDRKLEAVNRFVDRFINIRTLTRRSVTQTSIRDYIFEIVKEIRNKDEDQVFSILEMKINSSEIDPYSFMGGFSSGYIHYLLARFYYREGVGGMDSFSDYLRSRKRGSYVVYQIIYEEDNADERYGKVAYPYYQMSNYCLVRRNEVEYFDNLDVEERILRLSEKGYIEPWSSTAVFAPDIFWKSRTTQLYSNFCWIMELKENIYLDHLNNQQENQQE